MLSGRRNAVRIAGCPCSDTVVCQVPSPARLPLATGWSGAGAAVWSTTLAFVGPGATWRATDGTPPTTFPPCFGWLAAYCACSRPVTAQPRPWNRAHSASRAAVVSVPGAVNAWVMDTTGHSTRATTTRATIRRRMMMRRRCSRRSRRGRPGRCAGAGRSFVEVDRSITTHSTMTALPWNGLRRPVSPKDHAPLKRTVQLTHCRAEKASARAKVSGRQSAGMATRSQFQPGRVASWAATRYPGNHTRA